MDIKKPSLSGIPGKLKGLTGKVPKLYWIIGAVILFLISAGLGYWLFFMSNPAPPEVKTLPAQAKQAPPKPAVPAPASPASPAPAPASAPAKPGDVKAAPAKPGDAKPAAAKQAAPPAAATPPAVAVPPAAPGADGIISYEYNGFGRRDPFTSLIIKKEPDKKKGLAPIESYEVSEFKLIAILWNRAGYYAVVTLPDGKSYTVKDGMKLGLHNGKIYKITRDSVIIREQIRNERGVMSPQDTILKLRGEEE